MPRRLRHTWRRLVDSLTFADPNVGVSAPPDAIDAILLEDRVLFSAGPMPSLGQLEPTVAEDVVDANDVQAALSALQATLADVEDFPEVDADFELPSLNADTGANLTPADATNPYEGAAVDTDVTEVEQLLADLQNELASSQDSYAQYEGPMEQPPDLQSELLSGPLSFEANQGQTDAQVDFFARGDGYSVFLTNGDAVLRLQDQSDHVVRLNLVGGNSEAEASGLSHLSATTNYFIGSEANWLTSVDNYGRVQYTNVYEGIDVQYYGNQRQLEYDFVVAAGADPGLIQLDFAGAESIRIDENGELVLSLNGEGEELRFLAPYSYQQVDGHRQTVISQYVFHPDGTLGFELGAYDTSQELVIDPILDYGTYLGGSGNERAYGVTVDNAGSVYVTGYTSSLDFPTLNPYDGAYNSGLDIYVTKFNADGSSIAYSTYIGGSGDDEGWAISVDDTGAVYVAGSTLSTDFALTPGAVDNTHEGYNEAFALKLNAAGDTLEYSTYLGGNNSETGKAIWADNAGNAYVAGETRSNVNFPTTLGAFDTTFAGTSDGFLVKLNPTGSALDYGTYLGGDDSDYIKGLAVDGTGNAYVTGLTTSGNFTTAGGPYDGTYNGGEDAFLTQINPAGNGVVYSTFIGGTNDDHGNAVVLDDSGNIYLALVARSSDFSTTPGAFGTTHNGNDDAVVMKFDSGKSLLFSTFFGGAGYDRANGIVVDSSGNVHISGDVPQISVLPVTGDTYQLAPAGFNDSFLASFDATGSSLLYATYFGGSGSESNAGLAIDAADNLYLAGYSDSSDLWTSSGAYDKSHNGSSDAFVAKFRNADLVDALWLSTLDDVASSGAPGLPAWTDGTALSFADPNLTFGPGTTNGTFSAAFNLDSFAADSDADIDGIHFVTTNISVGSSNSVNLFVGDVLFSTEADETLTSTNSLTFNDEDVIVFRPDVPGDYSSGTFIFLLDMGSFLQNGGGDVTGLSLVEKTTTVGDASVPAGTFLITQDQQRIIRNFTATDVGLGTTAGAYNNLIHGPDISLDSEIRGVDLVEEDMSIGTAKIASGSILVTLNNDDVGVGDNLTLANNDDIFYLTVTATGQGSTAATATLLFEGANVGLDSTSENLQALTFASNSGANQAPGITTTGSTLAYTENDGAIAIDSGVMVSDVDSANLTNATVSIVTGIAPGEDSLAFVDQLGITGSYDAGTGILTLSGTASVADYQTALRSVAYQNSSENPETTNRNISFQVSDGISSSGSSRTVSVASINDDPTNTGSLPADVVVTEDVSSFVDLSAFNLDDVDAGNQLVTLTLRTSSGGLLYGSSDLDVTVVGSGFSVMQLTGGVSDINNFLDSPTRISYRHGTTHTNGDNADTIQVEANDLGNTGTGGSGTIIFGTVNVDITAVNDQPAGGNDTVVTLEDTDHVFTTAEFNFSDSIEGDNFANLILTAAPTQGTLYNDANGNGTVDGGETLVASDSISAADITAGRLKFKPVADASGSGYDSFAFQVQDDGGTANGGFDTDPTANTMTIDVTAVNDDPTNSGGLPSDLVFTEDIQGKLDLSLTDLSDVDAGSSNLTLTITSANGHLQTLGWPGVTVGGTQSVLILTGNLTDLNDFLNDVNSIDYEHATPNTNGDNVDLITIEVTDNGNTGSGGGGTILLGTTNIDITPVNDVPEATANTVNTVKDTAYAFVVGDFTFTDVEGDSLVSVTIDNQSLAGGTLEHSGGIPVNNGDTLTAAQLSTLMYTPVPGATGAPLATFDFTVNESGLGTVSAQMDIDVTPSNNPPVAVDDVSSVSEGAAVNIDLAANDSDADDGLDLTSITIVSGPTNGILVVNPDGTVDYTHDGSETVSDSFTYTIDDAAGSTSNVATVNLTINPQNDAPVANVDSSSVNEGAAVNIDLAANDSDADDGLDDLTSITIVSGPTNGILVVNPDGTVDYTHDGSETVSDSFTYTIDDAPGSTSNVATVNLTINPQNDAPVANVDSSSVNEGAAVNIDLAANDSDADDGLDLTSITIVSGPTNGILVVNPDGTVDYTHDGSETVSDSFTYTIDDAPGSTSNVATVNLTINPQNDAPVANVDSSSVNEGAAVNIDLAANDSDADDGLDLTSITIISGPTNGILAINPDGTVDYTHDGSETVSDNFTYTIDDAAGATSNVATVNLTINPQNDAPVANDDSSSVNEGAAVNIDLAANDSDADDGLDLTSITIVSGPTNGILVVNPDGTVDYTHDGSETVSDSFTYTIDDAPGSTSNVATVNLTINPQNDAPVANDDSSSVNEGAAVNIDLAANDSDADDGLDPTSITIISGPTNGILVVNPDGTVDYTHDGSETVNDSFTYTIDDAAGSTSNVATVNLTINPQNDAPVANVDSSSVNEGTAVNIDLAANDSDADDGLDLTSITIISGPAHGILVVNLDGTVDYTHDGSETVSDSFTYTIDDAAGSTSNVATVNLTINPQNDPPVANDDSSSVNEGAAVNIDLAVNDSDADDGLDLSSITIVSGPTNGILVVNPDGTVDYTHDGSETVSDSFTYTIDDATGSTSNVVTVNLTISPLNDAPLATADGYTINKGATLNVPAATGVSLNDTDAEGDPLSVNVLTGPTHGSLSLNADGSFTYTHDNSLTASDSFVYQVGDGNGGFSTATVNLTISLLNNAPVSVGDTYNVDEGASLNVAAPGVIANDTDSDGDPLTATLLTGPNNGTLTLNTDGSFTYTHDGSETTSDGFSYQVTDGNGGFDTATVSLTINSVNDVPVAVDDSYTLTEGGTLNVAGPGVMANDADIEGDLLAVSVLTGPSNGTLALNGDGSFTYHHDGGETTSDSFSYQLDDGNGGSALATVTLAINPLNDAPTITSSGSLTTMESVPLVLSTGNGNALTVDDMDAQSDPVIVTLSATNGVLTLAQTSGLTFGVGDGVDDPAMTLVGTLNDIRAALDGLEYRPQANFVGTASVQVTIDDQGNVGSGGPQTATTSINIDVTPDNAPLSRDDNASVLFGDSLVNNVLANDTDIDGDALVATLINSPLHGTLVFLADGSFTYTPDAGFVGLDSFSYVASDGVSQGQEAEVTISVAFAALSATSPPSTTTGNNTSEDEDTETIETILPTLTTGSQTDDATPSLSRPTVRRDRKVDTDGQSFSSASRDAGVAELTQLIANVSVGSYARPVITVGGVEVELLSSLFPENASPSTFSTSWLWQQMSEIAQRLESDSRTVTLGQVAFTTTATAISVGYVIWSIRSGYLLASMLTTMPAWQRVDPLPVLDFVSAKQNKHRRDQESGQPRKSLLESILGEQFSGTSRT